MAARTSRWLFLSLSLVLIIYIRDLLGHNGGGKVVEANIRVKIDTPGVLSLLESQLDSFTSPIAVDSNGEPIEGGLPSPVVASEPLVFNPPSLNFEDQSVGMPQLITVKVTNPSQTQNLHLNSISGESLVFHPSFFKSKVVKAGENKWTTFDVVFLPRVPGPVKDTLYIHTSHGTFDFKVQGVGVPNPFRLRPLLGAKIPLNATYSPLITMYNPFETALQITEMYSSGGDLHLELLSGQLQGSKSLWEIRPYETKPIARANFIGRSAINHTSFIRVKTNLEESPSIILPVEVEVSESNGLYLSRELLDFGILKTGETKSLPLFVLNSGPHTVHIKSISVVPDNPSIQVEPTADFLKPGSKYLKIASVTLTPILTSKKEEQSGHLEILAEDDRRMEYRLQVPFDSTILKGTLAFEKSQTMFRVGKPPFEPLIRNISLANHFNVPLVLYDIRLSSKAQEYFTVLDFHGPFTLPPTSDWHRPFALQFHAASSECLFNTTLRLSTNASLFNIPFYCYDGRVKYTLNATDNPNSEDVLDYGVLSGSDSVTKHFFLINPNPIRITIVSFLVGDSIPFTSVDLLRIEPADMTVDGAEDRVQIIGKKQGAKGPFYVEPDMVAAFRVNVTAPKKLGTFTGELLIHTSFDRILRVPVYYKTAVGSVQIKPDKNIFPPTFPYAIQKLPLLARSYYPQTLDIREVVVEPPDERFYFITERTENIPHLKPQALTELGTLVFDPLKGDPDTVYLGAGDLWNTIDYASELDAKFDRKVFSTLWDTWTNLQDEGSTLLNLSYVVHTAIDTTVPVPTEASLVWPTFSHSKEVQFQPTTIGNSSTMTLKLVNPSLHPVVVQPVLLHYYPHPQKIVQILFETGSIENIDFTHSQSSFSLDPNTWGYDTSLVSHVLIPGGERNEIDLQVKFLAQANRLSSTLLILRNNLTGLEYVLMQGRGLEGRFSIDGVQPGTGPLVFQFGSSDLDTCTEGTTLTEPLKLTKTFRMRNAGTSLMRIRRVGLGPAGMCEWNGFRVSHCGEDIMIHANRTKKLELSLVPDFTLSRIESTLTVESMEGVEMTFPVTVLLPHNMLATCYAVQPHPEWEEKLGYLITPVWLTILFFAAMLAFIQTNFGIISPKNDASLPTVQPTGGAVFDFGDFTKVLQNTLLEKLESIKKGVDAVKKEQAARKKHQKQQQRTFSSSSPTASSSSHPPRRHASMSPPSSPPRSATSRSREPPESTSELRQRITQPMNSGQSNTSERRTNDSKGVTKDTKRSESLSMATASSTGTGTRKLERNRHTSEPVKKSTEQPAKSEKSGASSTHQHTQHHTNTTQGSHAPKSSIDSTTTSHGQQKMTQTQQAGSAGSKSTSVDLSSAMTTDHETGMRKFVEQPSVADQGSIPPQSDSSTSKVKRQAKVSVTSSDASSSVPSTPTEGRSSTSSSASSSTVPTPVPQRKGRGVRKSSNINNKPQKVSPIPQTVTKTVTTATATAVMATPPPSPQVVKEHLERKASEGSLDSESTSSSNSDKSEKDDNARTDQAEIETNSNPPLAKEPGTGQTIPLLLAQEEFLLSKTKPSADEMTASTPVPNAALDAEKDGVVVVQERELLKKEKLPLLPTPRIRSKKKLRQQQRKEDKLRRKERGKEKSREKEEKRKEVASISEEPEVVNSPERQLVSSQHVEEDEEPELTKPKKIAAVSPKKAKSLELKSHNIKPAKSPGRSKTAPARVVVATRSQTPPPSSSTSSPSPPVQPLPPPPSIRLLSKGDTEESDDSPPESDHLSHTWAGRELDDHKHSPEPPSPTIQQDSSAFLHENSEEGSSILADHTDGVHLSMSHPMEAIPISALRAMRAKASKQQQSKIEEDENVATKTVHKKVRKMDKLPPRIVRLVAEKASTQPSGSTLPPHPLDTKKPVPKVFVDDVSTDSTPSPEPGAELTVKSKSPYIPPTSPHEIAATLLSKNPALQKRKVVKTGSGEQHDQEDMSYEADEGRYEKLQPLDEEDEEEEEEDEEDEEEEEQHTSGKVLWAADDDSPQKDQLRLMHHYKTAPTTLSLDAEPFYPSSDYPRSKHHKSHHHHHVDTPYAHNRHLDTPPGFSAAEEVGSSFERKYRVREVAPPQRLSLRTQHLRHHENTLTPSPPPYTIPSEAPSLYYPEEGRGGLDSSESSRYPRGHPPDISSYEISPEEYYSSIPSSGGGHGRRVTLGPDGVPSQRNRLLRNTVYDDPVYSSANHQQRLAAYAAAQRREAMSRASTNVSLALWEQSGPSSYHLTQEEEAALLQHEMKQHLRRKYQEEQAKLHARRSMEGLSPMNHPHHHRPSRSTLYPTEIQQPSHSKLWDSAAYADNVPDSYPSTVQSDEAFISESLHLQQLRQQRRQQHQQQLLQEQLNQMHPRRRRYSSDNELGGEILSDHLQTPLSPRHISSSGLNKAPGTAFSGMAQARQVAAREHEMWPENPEKQRESSTWSNSNIWSLDSSSSFKPSRSSSEATPGQRGPAFPGTAAEDQRSFSSDRLPSGSSAGRGGQLSSYLENTYDLFKDKNIWGIGTETPSANILPWEQMKSNKLPTAQDPK